ncbi:RNA polymerase recycling motor HelD [Litchfieldia salsa]|uniref:DNA helicase-2 / ATP-dependent DNA helicase PcrA n=1 Tax=Litchfieldia salsa TaxID=930152 RepID=A0A1H0RSI6_9BACI|nr:RNA polymerase recycling motor HelD [Litchfieldia salsa]SDP31906.1 DNA helicase-2 / ATP-dependent DNA helicase PcrA [Litchfieldia salsa]
MTELNKDLEKEQLRVDNVMKQIDSKIKLLEHNTGGLKKDIIGIRSEFWEDVTVNFDEADDLGETFTSIKQQNELLSERERSHRQFYQQMKNLDRLKHSPYFGRVDFHENGEREVDQIYLGISSLMDENDENFIIYDWRAPISSLYYDYAPGPAKYDTPEGIIEGNMELKRQFIIRDGWIKSMFETGVTIGDEILQEVLGNQANTQMKSIVSTIQKEQNQIIRNEKSKILIVQGVAGSGKTSAALQRVAYLLYRYRNTISADNIMLFSPNSMFNSYVATVLPELGEENMKQTTFQAYLESRLGNQYRLEDPFTQIEYVLNDINDPLYKIRLTAIKYKASLDYKNLIDQYLTTLSEEGLVFKKIDFRGKTIISSEQIQSYFYSLEKSITISNRINLVSEWLLKKLSKIEKVERTKDWVIEEAQLLDREDYLKVYNKLQKDNRFNENTFDDYEREEQLLAKFVIKRSFRPIKKAIKAGGFINMKAIYLNMLHWSIEKGAIFRLPDCWKEMCDLTLNRIEEQELLYEDATPYLYLQEQIEGKRTDTLIRHLFIDEAQDYSPFQFAFLKQLFPNSRMTVLGDINQTIYTHAMNESNIFASEEESDEQESRIKLMRSYRSTKQIVEFTKGLIPGGEKIEAFNRYGEKPTLTEVSQLESLHEALIVRTEKLQDEGNETIAIICKTASECKDVYEALCERLTLKLVTSKTREFDKGVIVIPSYLAKGIEFDGVIIYDCSSNRYNQESERKLFYTACTRAMHELHMFSLGEKSPFLQNVDRETYEIMTQ